VKKFEIQKLVIFSLHSYTGPAIQSAFSMINTVAGELSDNTIAWIALPQYIFDDNVNAEIRGSIFHLQNTKEWIS